MKNSKVRLLDISRIFLCYFLWGSGFDEAGIFGQRWIGASVHRIIGIDIEEKIE